MVFSGCEKLESVTFEKGSVLKTIQMATFYNCKELKSIEIPRFVEKIYNSAFEGCTNLKSVTFEEGSDLKMITDESFKDCSSLRNIKIPENVTYIYKDAFTGCTNLETVEFLNFRKLEEITKKHFENTNDNITIIFNHPNPFFNDDNSHDDKFRSAANVNLLKLVKYKRIWDLKLKKIEFDKRSLKGYSGGELYEELPDPKTLSNQEVWKEYIDKSDYNIEEEKVDEEEVFGFGAEPDGGESEPVEEESDEQPSDFD